MKRDMALIRRILIYLEEHNTIRGMLESPNKEESELATYHLKLISEAGFTDPVQIEYFETDGLHVRSSTKFIGLTWEGHDFLDSIRDESVWNKTQQQVAKVGGATSILVWKELAVGFAKRIVGLEE